MIQMSFKMRKIEWLWLVFLQPWICFEWIFRMNKSQVNSPLAASCYASWFNHYFECVLGLIILTTGARYQGFGGNVRNYGACNSQWLVPRQNTFPLTSYEDLSFPSRLLACRH